MLHFGVTPSAAEPFGGWDLPFVLDQYASSIPFVVPNVQPGFFEAATTARLLFGLAVVLSLLFLPGGLASATRLLGRR